MTVVADPDVLRARARALRSLAARLDASVLHDLLAAAGDDTWRGPTADAFVADVRRSAQRCVQAAEELRGAARALEATAAVAAGRLMGYLGYDRARLVALRRRLGQLADERASLRFTDALAGDAALSYHNATDLLIGWLTDLAAIDSCGFSSPYRPVGLDPGDPALVDVLHPGDAAWSTVTDPRAAIVASVTDHARHVAEYLAAVDVGDVLGDRQRTDEVVRLISVAVSSAAGRDALLAALGAVRFGALADDLARRVALQGSSPEATVRAAAATLVLGALAAGVGPAQRAGAIDTRVWDDQLAEHTDPYAAALVVRVAGMAAADLAVVALAAWRRWDARTGDDTDELAAAGEQAPAILLAALATQPLAARRVLEQFDLDDFGLLFSPSLGGADGTDSIDSNAVLAVLLASADPTVGDADDVERSMVNVLGFLAGHQHLATASGVSAGLGAYARALPGAPRRRLRRVRLPGPALGSPRRHTGRAAGLDPPIGDGRRQPPELPRRAWCWLASPSLRRASRSTGSGCTTWAPSRGRSTP